MKEIMQIWHLYHYPTAKSRFFQFNLDPRSKKIYKILKKNFMKEEFEDWQIDSYRAYKDQFEFLEEELIKVEEGI